MSDLACQKFVNINFELKLDRKLSNKLNFVLILYE